MKIIKPKDFPIEMNAKNIEILAKMSLMFPNSLCFNEILPFLKFEEQILISNKVKKIREEVEKIRWNSLSPDEQKDEKRKLEESYNDTTSFRGNLLEQERHSIDIEKKRKKNNS